MFFMVISFAVMVQVGRSLFPILDDYRVAVESQLSIQLGVDLSIGEIEAKWQGLRPSVSLNEVSILNGLGEPVFLVERIDIEASILKTLRDWRLSFRQLSFRGLQATLTQMDNGRWRVLGLPESTPATATPSVTSKSKIDDPLDIFLYGRKIELTETSLDFVFLDNLETNVVVPHIRLENDGEFHRLGASFAVDGEEQALHLIVEGQGDPRDDDSKGLGFLTLTDFPLQKVLAVVGVNRNALFPDDANVDAKSWHEDGRVDLNLWFGGSIEKGLNWRGDVSVEGVPFIPKEGMVWPKTLTSDFSGGWHLDQGWRLGVANLDLRWDDFTAPMVTMEVRGELGKPVRAAIETLDVGGWNNAIAKAGFANPRLQGILGKLKPRGKLHSIWVDLLDKESGYFALRAQVEGVGVEPWLGVPAIDNINGYLELSAFDGHLSLNSQQGFSLNFPQIYLHPLTFTEAEGDIRWSVDRDNRMVGISSSLLDLRGKEASAKGFLNLHIPFKASSKNEPQMTLVIGVDKGLASLHKVFVPYTIPKELINWLDESIKDGLLTDAGFIYHGSIMKNFQLSRVLQFSAKVDQATLKFDPSWPALEEASGALVLDDQEFKVSNLQGRMMDTFIDDGEVSLISLPPVGGKAGRNKAILLKGKVRGDSSKTLELLKQSPIKNILGEELASWQIQGSVRGTIDLVVPLTKSGEGAEQHIHLNLARNQLNIPNLDLSFEDISGPLRYSHTHGVESSQLKATLWGQEIKAKIHTLKSGEEPAVHVAFDGDLDVRRLQQWSRRPALAFTEGVTFVKGQLDVPIGGETRPIHMEVSSDLKGIHIDLPPPFAKQVEQALAFKTVIDIHPADAESLPLNVTDSAKRHRYWLSFGDFAQLLVSSKKDNLEGISLALGEPATVVDPGFLSVFGSIKKGDASEWVDAVVQYQNYVEQQKVKVQTDTLITVHQEGDIGNSLPLKMNVNVEELQLGSLAFDKVSIIAEQDNHKQEFHIDSQNLAGVCTVFDDNRPVKVDLAYLTLPEGEATSVLTKAVLTGTASTSEVASEGALTPQVDEGGLAGLNIDALNAFDFSVDKIVKGERNYGKWSFKLRPIDGGVVAYDLYAEVLGLTVKGKGDSGGELIWLRSGGKDETFFSGIITAKNVGQVMLNWDMEKALTSQQAKFTTDVQWSGAPDQITLAKLFGVIDINLERGRFIRGASAGENPFVKLVGLLNFDTLARRFRLDFSDLNPEGLGYEKITGSFQFKQGLVTTQEPLFVDMPASHIRFAGDIDVLQELVDAQLVVTLPLAGNLTVLAAFTGGVPLAVGVFVAGKIFKPQVDQASSIRYRVNGTWEEPEVKLEKVFENETGK